MTITPQSARVRDPKLLQKINQLLRDYGMDELAEIGDYTRLETEIIGMPVVDDSALPWFRIFRFPVILANGELGVHHMCGQPNGAYTPGTVVVLMINGRVVRTRQFRATFGRYFSEAPRGFGRELKSRPDVFADVPTKFDGALGVILRELPEQMLAGVTASHFWHLGDVPPDTGRTMGYDSYYLVHLTVSDEVFGDKKSRKGLRANDGIIMEIVTLESATNQAEDSHTIVALCGFDKEIRGNLTKAGIHIVEPV